MPLAIVGATASVRWRRARWTLVRGLTASLVALVASGATAAWACALPAQPSLVDALVSIEGRLPALPELAASDAARLLLQRPLQHAAAPSVALEIAASEVYGVPWPAEDVENAEGDAPPPAIAEWARTASRSVSAYGVFVRDRSLGAIVAAGTYWASPLLDRLEVRRLDGPWPGSMPNARLLATAGSCQVQARTWLELPIELLTEMTTLDESTADDAYVYLVVTLPGGEPARRWIGLDELVAAVTFDHPATRDAVAFHAWFAGPTVDPVTLARALPRVRSNLGPRALWGLVQDLR